ncbi:MAG: hypothetical protein A3F42_03190 [Gammaproteobacteria bacterium RIFCSPHIGHO2_12_FULL_37_34]|nr:MAG: hypothetical protein A3F42_03190 [Gammaproteobacteria bacterium RIFCSPHIGHO2_12_FULL_37_34]
MPNENEAVEQKKSPIHWATIGIFFSTLAVVITIFAASYGYAQLTTITITLTKVISSLENELTNTQRNFVSLQQMVNNFATTMQQSAALAHQQEKLLMDWQAAQEGNLDKWYMAEAQHLVRLANDYTPLTNAQTITIALLQRADEALRNVKDSRVVVIQKSLATDIYNLQHSPQVNINTLYVQLANLDKQLNQLPLPIMQLKQESKLSSDMTKTDSSWWQKGLERSWQMLRQIVIVHYNGSHTLPLIIPDEKIFLYQNLHAQMENAIWGLLHNNMVVYQLSLQQAMDWIQQYFVQDAELTKNILQNLQALQKITIQPLTINLTPTLQLFDDYFGIQKTE